MAGSPETTGRQRVGINNRQRRAAKKKARDRARADQGPGPGWWSGGVGLGDPDNELIDEDVAAAVVNELFAEVLTEFLEAGYGDDADTGFDPSSPPTADDIAAVAAEIAIAHAQGDPEALALGAALLGDVSAERSVELVDRGLELAAARVCELLWANGWLPVDVIEHAGRTLSAASVELARDLMAAQVGQYATASLHPRWRTSIEHARVGAGRAGAAAPVVTAWAARTGHTRHDTLTTTLGVLGFGYGCPALPEIVPPPGHAAAAGSPTIGTDPALDPRLLARVRGLLAKAESTWYPDEAEALSAKAQELMARHALEQAALEAERDTPQTAITTRLWLDGPYVPAKSTLVASAAAANRCVCVRSSTLEMVSLVGHPADLATVEVLVTSLLLQAHQAMLAAGQASAAGGRACSAKFRRSFLLAYADRIGERLENATATAADDISDDRLLPALRDRATTVNDTVIEVFGPTLEHTTMSINDIAGWRAGRAAADTASLTPDHAHLNSGT
jgi:hypothetical protein